MILYETKKSPSNYLERDHPKNRFLNSKHFWVVRSLCILYHKMKSTGHSNIIHRMSEILDKND